MKKHIKRLAVLFACICFFALAGCSKKPALRLPAPEETQEIEILKNTSETGKVITDKQQIAQMIADLQNNTKPTRQESVNDHPTNIDRYILIRFHSTSSELSPSVAYLYRKMDTCYLEQPYSGIWKLEASVLDAIAADL